MQCLSPQAGVAVAFADIDDVLYGVGGEDEQRFLAPADAESLALADGVEVRPAVLADLLAVADGVAPRGGQCCELFGCGGYVGRVLSARGVGIPVRASGGRGCRGGDCLSGIGCARRDSGLGAVFRPRGEYLVDITPFRGQLLLQEGRKVDLAHEADALRILALGRGEPLLGGDAPHLGFEQIADGEQGVAQLFLRELAEEVALILVGVGAREEFIDCSSVGERLLGLAAVVPRGDEIGAQPERFAQEDVEFDFAVAQHVGVGRASLFVFREHVIDHAGAVVRREVDDVQRDVQFFCDQLGEDAVVVPRAVALERSRRVVPVDHEQPHDVMPLLFEQVGGDR